MNENNDSKECCPEFDTTLWDDKTHNWNEKLFIKDSLPQFFHIPSSKKVEKLLTGLWKKAQDAGAAPDIKDFLLLAYDPSPWKGVFLMAVNKEVPNAEHMKLSGTFYTKVFDGPFNKVPAYVKEMEKILKDKGKEAKQYYFYFTTCPKCAEKYGHNYIVSFAQLK